MYNTKLQRSYNFVIVRSEIKTKLQRSEISFFVSHLGRFNFWELLFLQIFYSYGAVMSGMSSITKPREVEWIWE